MALDDLDLEFEDEEEAKKKKSDAVMQDVDLEFHSQDEVKPRPTRPPGAPQAPSAPARPQAPQQPMAQVKKIDEARAAQAQGAVKRPAGAPQPAARPAPVSSAPRAVGNAALNSAPVQEGHYDLESEEIVQLREKARKVEFDADVKVQVAEFKTEILSELLSDMKLMDHQINQLLVRINAKHPDMKQEVLMIKKILADYTTKKRK